jgi:signal peptidase I
VRLRRWHIVVAVVLLLLLLLTRLFVLQPFSVAGESMQGAADDGSTVVANRLSYLFGDPERGDIVVMQQPREGQSGVIIKRVIGLPGETVEMRNCDVLIDGVLLDEPYRAATSVQCDVEVAPTVIGDDEVFVLGDLRDRSDDSRYFGLVPFDLIVGRVIVTF